MSISRTAHAHAKRLPYEAEEGDSLTGKFSTAKPTACLLCACMNYCDL